MVNEILPLVATSEHSSWLTTAKTVKEQGRVKTTHLGVAHVLYGVTVCHVQCA